MAPLLLAGLISGGIQLGKGIIGAVQAGRANKKLKNLTMPTYKTPEEISQITDMFKQRASATEMPGQRRFEENLGQAYAEGVSEAQRTASSSLMATGAATDLAGKRMQAIQDLAGQFAEFKAQRQQELAGALQTQADYRDQEFKLNQYDPYFIKRNELTSQRQAGAENMWSGIEGIGSTAINLMGTNAYLDVLKGLQGQGGGTSTQKTRTLADIKKPSLPKPQVLSYKGTLKPFGEYLPQELYTD